MIIVSDALTCKAYFHVVAGEDEANSIILYTVGVYNLLQISHKKLVNKTVKSDAEEAEIP